MNATLTDAAGCVHEPCAEPRILSLVPSLTELIVALDLSEYLVGRTQYCIHPKSQLIDIPTVGGTKKINMDRALALRPTHAIVNIDETPKPLADALDDAGVIIIVTHPMSPDDNPGLFRLIGALFNASAQAATLIDRFDVERRKMEPASAHPAMRVLYLIWKKPWMAVRSDTYIGKTLQLVNWHVIVPGADPELTGDAARYPEVTLTAETLATTDLVLFSSEPYTFKDDDIDAFKRAFPEHAGKAHMIDGEMTSWYGPRAIAGLGYLRDLATALA